MLRYRKLLAVIALAAGPAAAQTKPAPAKPAAAVPSEAAVAPATGPSVRSTGAVSSDAPATTAATAVESGAKCSRGPANAPSPTATFNVSEAVNDCRATEAGVTPPSVVAQGVADFLVARAEQE